MLPWIAGHDIPPGGCMPAETMPARASEALRIVPRRGGGVARTATPVRPAPPRESRATRGRPTRRSTSRYGWRSAHKRRPDGNPSGLLCRSFAMRSRRRCLRGRDRSGNFGRPGMAGFKAKRRWLFWRPVRLCIGCKDVICSSEAGRVRF